MISIPWIYVGGKVAIIAGEKKHMDKLVALALLESLLYLLHFLAISLFCCSCYCREEEEEQIMFLFYLEVGMHSPHKCTA